VGVILVTGTDTGVGKTWVTRALGRALVTAGRRVVAIKPVESGCDGRSWSEEDGVLLAAATGQVLPYAALRRMAAPVAPAMAAEAERLVIDFDDLLLEIESHAAGSEIVLVEGAGGLLAPITWEWGIVDLARALGASALGVASDRLGTINHTLLTLGALELSGIPLLGVALTTPAEPDRSSGANAAAIARMAGHDRVLALPRQVDPFKPSASLAEVVGWVTSSP
jgi:dethiobiotin synthetase